MRPSGRASPRSAADTRWVDGLPTALMKPLSGSGARGLMIETMTTHGADSFAGRLACIIQGSTETTFYVLAVYFGSVGIRRTRHAVACGLAADAAGVVAAILLTYLFFGKRTVRAHVDIVFWTCLGMLFYVYAGYPLLAWLLGKVVRRRLAAPAGDHLPTVTVLIAAHNEVREIVATVRNKLDQEYPAPKLDVIVVSDGSTDGTDEAVLAIGDPRVRLIRQEPRQGKTSA